MIDLSRSPLPIPPEFRHVRYNAAHFPGAAGVSGVEGGANCQQYAYSVLRHFGFQIPDLRSSDLWQDSIHTVLSDEMKPFDLVLVNDNPLSFGAHVGLCVGEDWVLHLSKKVDAPAIETLSELLARTEYSCLIGFKTVRVRH